MEFFNDHKTIIIVIACLLLFVIYSVISVFINKLSDAVKGKTTILSWIPPFNVYLLGELVVNKIIGILLSIMFLFGIIIAIPNIKFISNVIPKEIVLPYLIVYVLIIIILLLIGKSKLNRIIREGTSNDEMSRFIAKDYNDVEPVKEETIKPKEIEESIKDEYQYNHTSLSEVSHLNDNSNKNNP